MKSNETIALKALLPILLDEFQWNTLIAALKRRKWQLAWISSNEISNLGAPLGVSLDFVQYDQHFQMTIGVLLINQKKLSQKQKILPLRQLSSIYMVLLFTYQTHQAHNRFGTEP